MPYPTYEASVQDANPLEFYVFQVGTTFHRYISAQELLNSGAEPGVGTFNFDPIEISHTQPDQSKELARSAITVTVPRDATIAQQFVAFVPTTRIHLLIFRLHHGDDPANFVQVWKGRVNAVNFKESLAEITCNPTMMGLKRMGLRKNYGASCQHALYGAGCGVLKAGYLTPALLTAVVGDVLTATVIGTKAVTWFPGGYAERTNGELRFIIGQVGSTVTVLVPFNNLLAGETVDLYAGCARDIETCFAKFNTPENVDAENFFGFHVNPKRNPFKTGLK